MPTLDWYDKYGAVAQAGKVPFRLLEHVPEYFHGKGGT